MDNNKRKTTTPKRVASSIESKILIIWCITRLLIVFIHTRIHLESRLCNGLLIFGWKVRYGEKPWGAIYLLNKSLSLQIDEYNEWSIKIFMYLWNCTNNKHMYSTNDYPWRSHLQSSTLSTVHRLSDITQPLMLIRKLSLLKCEEQHNNISKTYARQFIKY